MPWCGTPHRMPKPDVIVAPGMGDAQPAFEITGPVFLGGAGLGEAFLVAGAFRTALGVVTAFAFALGVAVAVAVAVGLTVGNTATSGRAARSARLAASARACWSATAMVAGVAWSSLLRVATAPPAMPRASRLTLASAMTRPRPLTDEARRSR